MGGHGVLQGHVYHIRAEPVCASPRVPCHGDALLCLLQIFSPSVACLLLLLTVNVFLTSQNPESRTNEQAAFLEEQSAQDIARGKKRLEGGVAWAGQTHSEPGAALTEEPCGPLSLTPKPGAAAGRTYRGGLGGLNARVSPHESLAPSRGSLGLGPVGTLGDRAWASVF